MENCFPISFCRKIVDSLFECFCAGVNCVYKFEDNLEDLKDEVVQLNDLIKDVKCRVEKEEVRGLQPMETVRGWVKRAENLIAQVDGIINVSGPKELQRLFCLGYSSKDRHTFGKMVAQTLKDVKELKRQGIFDVVAGKVSRKASAAVVEERNIELVTGLMRSSAITLQRGLTTMTACNECKKIIKSAIVIQAHWRCHQAYSKYKRLQKAVIVTQYGWRCRIARRDLRNVKMATRRLEKQVDELTGELKREERLRFNLEEEIDRLEDALHIMRSQLERAYDMVRKESEAAQKASDKALLLLQKEKTKQAEKAYANALARNKELTKMLEEAEREMEILLETIWRLQVKVSNLELEKKVVRQQILLISPTAGSLTTRPERTIIQENQEQLLECLLQDIGFAEGKPVAARLIYKCLLHCKSFEDENTSIFYRIIQIIESAVKDQDNNNILSYWLSNSATLLMLLHNTLKTSGEASVTLQRKRAASISQGLRASPQSAGLDGGVIGGLDDLQQVEVKYPALLFKHQLTAFFKKIYGMIRDNLKGEISSSLVLCIQAPLISHAVLVKESSETNAGGWSALIAHWQSIVKCLNNCLTIMKAHYVPSFLISEVFCQTFSFINVVLFDSVLLARQCCTFSNGKYIKLGLDELEKWGCDATEEFVGSAWDELKHIRQAVGFLVTDQSPIKTFEELTELCPALSLQQLYRISIMYWNDKYNRDGVSEEVLSMMNEMVEESDILDDEYLLDDDSRIPFSLDDISNSMQQIEVPDVDPPPLLSQNSSFRILKNFLSSRSLSFLLQR